MKVTGMTDGELGFFNKETRLYYMFKGVVTAVGNRLIV
jgi:hypothetical protein